MIKAPLAQFIAAGLFSALLFALTLTIGFSLFTLFIPTLPIFVSGLLRPSPIPVFISTLAIIVMAGPQIGAFYLLLLGLPVHYFCRQALRQDRTGEWQPVGRILTSLTGFACLFITLLALSYSYATGEAFDVALNQEINLVVTELQKQFNIAVEPLHPKLAFLLLSAGVWIWLLTLFGFAWLAQRLLQSRSKQLRPDLSLGEFTVPQWVLELAAISALASVIGSPTAVFLGSAILIILMLPYFLLGAALMHKTSHQWPNRRIFLFFIYFFIAFRPWAALILAGYGMWHHIKRLSAPKT